MFSLKHHLQINRLNQTDGIDGAICNVEYYIGNQTRAQIANSYNLLVKQNPPINIL